MLAFAASQLEQNLSDLPFTLTYLFDDDGAARLAGRAGCRPGIRPRRPVLAADGSGLWPVEEPARGESVLLELVGDAYPALPSGDWPEPPTQALVVPLSQQGGAPSGFLVAGAEPVSAP